jgi:hypothetical protein
MGDQQVLAQHIQNQTIQMTTATKPQPQQNRNFTPPHHFVTEAGVSTYICDQRKTKTKKHSSKCQIEKWTEGLDLLLWWN